MTIHHGRSSQPDPKTSLKEQPSVSVDETHVDKYYDYPLVQSMIIGEKIRHHTFEHDGYDQFNYPASNSGWLQTLFVTRGRALDHVFIPWILLNAHSVFVCIILLTGLWEEQNIREQTESWNVFYANVLNVTLSLLLVFRLNRCASRFWFSRQCWGLLIAYGRTMTTGLMVHGSHNPTVRDNAIKWIAATGVSTMVFMRGDKKIPDGCLAGILNETSIEQLQASKHGPLYTSGRIRDNLKQLFLVTGDTPLSLAHAWTVQLDRFEDQLNLLMNQFGAMERVRSTPLPIVYVSHLRTFLIIYLALFPYVFGTTLGWYCIPIHMITSFAFLGIEAASSEVQNPFKQGRPNNINMDALAMALIENIQQEIQDHADMEIDRKQRIV